MAYSLFLQFYSYKKLAQPPWGVLQRGLLEFLVFNDQFSIVISGLVPLAS